MPTMSNAFRLVVRIKKVVYINILVNDPLGSSSHSAAGANYKCESGIITDEAFGFVFFRNKNIFDL